MSNSLRAKLIKLTKNYYPKKKKATKRFLLYKMKTRS